MKKNLLIILFVFSALLSFCFITLEIRFNQTDELDDKTPIKTDSVSIVKINLVGDLMCHSVQFNYARKKGDKFNFDGVFREVRDYLSSADFTIGNFETVLAGKERRYSGFPYFNAPDEFLEAIKNTGFDLLITANNHAIDKGEYGLKRTILKMDEIKIHRTGTFLSQADRDSIRVYNIKDIKLAVLAFTYGTNGIPVPKEKNYLINLIDKELLKHDILDAKEISDIVLIFFHFGNEYEHEPNSFQKDIVKFTIESGADIIIGSHPHAIQPVNYFKTNNGKLDSGFVAYSLGNFLSNQRWRYSDAGVILQLEISKKKTTDSVYLKNVSYLPTWVFKGKTDNGREYIILPTDLSNFDPTRYYLTGRDSSLMNQAHKDTKSILTRYNTKIEQNIPAL